MTDEDKTKSFQTMLNAAATAINIDAEVTGGRYHPDRMAHVFDVILNGTNVRVIEYSRDFVDDALDQIISGLTATLAHPP